MVCLALGGFMLAFANMVAFQVAASVVLWVAGYHLTLPTDPPSVVRLQVHPTFTEDINMGASSPTTPGMAGRPGASRLLDRAICCWHSAGASTRHPPRQG